MVGTASLGLIVEGHGDVVATPVLARRVLEMNDIWPNILPAHRVAKTKMLADLNRAVRLQLSRVGALGGVLVLVDADSDDPEHLAESLRSSIDPDLAERCRVVVATKEFEAWFLGDVRSLQPHKSMRDDAVFDGNPEAPRDAKGRLAALMNESYQETIHQASFSSLVDLASVASRCPSFVRFSDSVVELSKLEYQRIPHS